MDAKKDFIIKDSGKHTEFESGMKRDTNEHKARFDLLIPNNIPYDEQLLTRFAIHLAKGAIKYTERNWEKANGEKELNRFKESALRHFMQWYCGLKDEDHASAVLFNIMGKETVEYKLNKAT